MGRRGVSAAVRDRRGMTIPELAIALSVAAIGTAMSFGAFFQYQQSISTSRAARAIGADVQLTRGLAIRARAPVSIVANETLLRYVIRDTTGTVYYRRDFGNGSQIELTGLDFATAGDSLTFDGRGVLVTGGTPTVSATRHAKTRSVTLNGLGRAQIN